MDNKSIKKHYKVLIADEKPVLWLQMHTENNWFKMKDKLNINKPHSLLQSSLLTENSLWASTMNHVDTGNTHVP